MSALDDLNIRLFKSRLERALVDFVNGYEVVPKEIIRNWLDTYLLHCGERGVRTTLLDEPNRSYEQEIVIVGYTYDRFRIDYAGRYVISLVVSQPIPPALDYLAITRTIADGFSGLSNNDIQA